MPEPLQNGTEAISLEDLAGELGVTPDRLKPLLDRNYLKVIGASSVVKPAPAAMAWLRTMMMPLPMRPFLPSQMAADLTGTELNDLRRLCLLYNIPLHDDPVFGELMSVSGFHKFFESLHHFREPSRFDRMALLGMLMTAVPESKRAPRTMPFSKRLDREIARIAKLKEPERMERALALWESYSDAKAVAHAIEPETPEIPGMESLERVLVRSMGEGFTDESVDDNPL